MCFYILTKYKLDLYLFITIVYVSINWILFLWINIAKIPGVYKLRIVLTYKLGSLSTAWFFFWLKGLKLFKCNSKCIQYYIHIYCISISIFEQILKLSLLWQPHVKALTAGPEIGGKMCNINVLANIWLNNVSLFILERKNTFNDI